MGTAPVVLFSRSTAFLGAGEGRSAAGDAAQRGGPEPFFSLRASSLTVAVQTWSVDDLLDSIGVV